MTDKNTTAKEAEAKDKENAKKDKEFAEPYSTKERANDIKRRKNLSR